MCLDDNDSSFDHRGNRDDKGTCKFCYPTFKVVGRLIPHRNERCRQEEAGSFANMLEKREGARATECLKHAWRS